MSKTITPSHYQHKSSYVFTSKDLTGIDWLPATGTPLALTQYDEYNPADADTIYRPLDGPLAVAFDITREDFEVAAALDIAGFFQEQMPADGPDLPNYDLVGSLSAEGYAKDTDNNGYAESFFTDEVEVYLGLINENDTPDDLSDDEVVGAVEVEIDFKRKVDILLNGGANIEGLLDSIGTGALLSMIKGIDITYYGDTNDPLVAGIASIAGGVAEFIAHEIPQLASLIEIEAGDPHASHWANSTFDALRTPVQTMPV
jgi:hypothetical protein